MLTLDQLEKAKQAFRATRCFPWQMNVSTNLLREQLRLDCAWGVIFPNDPKPVMTDDDRRVLLDLDAEVDRWRRQIHILVLHEIWVIWNLFLVKLSYIGDLFKRKDPDDTYY